MNPFLPEDKQHYDWHNHEGLCRTESQIALMFYQLLLPLAKEMEHYQRATVEQQNAENARIQANSQTMAGKLLAKIVTKDALALLGALHNQNPTSKAAFTLATGVKLPKTEKGTREAVRQWIGTEAFDKAIAEHDADIDRRRKADDDARDAREREAALSKSVRFELDGNQQVATLKSFLEQCVAAGYRLEVGKAQGFNARMNLRRGTNYFTLKTKAEKQYATELIAQLEPQPCPVS